MTFALSPSIVFWHHKVILRLNFCALTRWFVFRLKYRSFTRQRREIIVFIWLYTRRFIFLWWYKTLREMSLIRTRITRIAKLVTWWVEWQLHSTRLEVWFVIEITTVLIPTLRVRDMNYAIYENLENLMIINKNAGIENAFWFNSPILA